MGQEEDWRRKAEELKRGLGITAGSLGDKRKGFRPDPTQGKTIRDWIKSQPPKPKK